MATPALVAQIVQRTWLATDLMASGHVMQLQQLADMLPNPPIFSGKGATYDAVGALAELGRKAVHPLLPLEVPVQAVKPYVTAGFRLMTSGPGLMATKGCWVPSESEVRLMLSVSSDRVAGALAAMPEMGRESLGQVVHYMVGARAQQGVPERVEFPVLMIAYTIASLWQPGAAA